MTGYSAGSIWRKWDLQVQTRIDKGYKCLGNDTLTEEQILKLCEATGLSKAVITSQEKSITAEEYAKLFVAYITYFTDIEVVAVTDHNSGEELDYLIAEAEKTEGKLSVLPGVEVSSNQGIHILCIFDPSKRNYDTWKDTVEHFLTKIKVPDKRFADNGSPANSKLGSDAILKLTNEEGGLCIFAHIGTENGLFYKWSPTANGGTVHADIYKDSLCNIVQIPSNGNLSNGVKNILAGGDVNYGNKTVAKIKCSDSRRLSDIGNSFTWIKSDPTFGGLMQIIMESKDRVSLETAKPDSKQPYHVIDSFSFNHSDFLPDTIPLNRNLVTIIGGKSTGKSLLLYHLAKTADPEEVSSRFNGDGKYGDLKYEMDMTITWYDGHTTTLGQHDDRRKVTYIPQNYLNQLSDQNDKAVHEIVTELLLQQPGALNIKKQFSDATRQHNENLSQAVQKFFNTLSDISETRKKLKELGDKAGIESYIKRLEKEIQEAAKSAGLNEEEIEERQELEDKWYNLTERYIILNDDYNALKKMWNDRQSMVDFTRVYNSANSLSDPIQKRVNAKIESLKKQTNEKIEQIIKVEGTALKDSKKQLYIEAKAIAKPLKKYRKKAKELTTLKEKQELLRSIKIKHKNVIDLTASIKDLDASKNKSKSEIVREYSNIHSAYEDFCSSLSNLHKTLEGVNIIIETDFNAEKYLEGFIETFVDKRADKGTLEVVDLSYDGKNSEGYFKKAESIFDAILNGSVKTKGQYTKEEIINNLFSDRFTVSYSIRYQGDNFTSMSPGKRGLVLLKLLVDLDQNSHPILLDQPEDDLDNRSIYYDLVDFIRKRKRDRQIIVVTHNPNLVVGADAEQVIVANQQGEEGTENKKYKFEYVSGSIENSYLNKDEKAVLQKQGIREHICEILEGGEEAFKKRERKYNIPNELA